MIEWRRPPQTRRTGEGLGAQAIALILKLMILAVLVWSGYEGGRMMGGKETRADVTERVQKAEKDLLEFKIWHYGKDYFYFMEKGQLCYVTKAEDLENPKKWRRTR